MQGVEERADLGQGCWEALVRLGQLNLLDDDLRRLAAQLQRSDEVAWVRVQLRAADYLAWHSSSRGLTSPRTVAALARTISWSDIDLVVANTVVSSWGVALALLACGAGLVWEARSGGFRHILVVMDMYSGWVWCHAKAPVAAKPRSSE